MDSKKFNKYKTVADIIEKSFETLKKLSLPGANIYQLRKITDDYIIGELAKTYKNLSKGLAMPTCISVNNIICHYLPDKNEEYKLKSGDIVRIEVAAHIDQCCVTLGDTIEIETNTLDDLKIAQLAVTTGIRNIEPFMEIKEFDKLIKKIVESHGYYLLERPYAFNEDDVRLQYDWARREDGQFLEQSWVVKCDQEIDLENLNELSEEKFEQDKHFNVGDVYQLEIAFSKDKKPCNLSYQPGRLFQRTYHKYSLKSKIARELLSEVNKNIGEYFFSLDNLNISESRARLGMKECHNHHIFRSLGLIEKKDTSVIRIKCSVIIQDNSVYVLTGKSNIIDKIEELEKDKEILKIFNKNPKFSKRYQEENPSVNL